MTLFRNWRQWALLAGDLVLMNAALWLALSVRHATPAGLPEFELHLVPFNLLFLGWIVVCYAAGLYDLRRLRRLPDLLNNLLAAGAVNVTLGVTYFYFFYPYRAVGMTPKTHLVLTAAIAPVLVFGWRRAGLRLFRLNQLRQRVAFLGDGAHVREIRRDLRRHGSLGYRPVPCRWPGVDLVVADGRWVDRHWERARPAVEAAVTHRVPVLSLPAFYEALFGKVLLAHAASASWLFGSVLSRTRSWYHPVKRGLDLVAGAALLAALSPLIGALALLGLLCQGRPVFFGQARVGRGGRTFTMWKLRTMREGGEADGPFRRDGAGGSRVTALGGFLRRWRLDELPQLWNVLRGEMALVGPRPEWTKEVEVLRVAIPHYELRHLVRPGMTGWAQLNFRATSDPKDSLEKFRFDLWYLQHCSLTLDLTILLRTARRLVQRDAGVPAGHRRLLGFSERDAERAANLGALLARNRDRPVPAGRGARRAGATRLIG